MGGGGGVITRHFVYIIKNIGALNDLPEEAAGVRLCSCYDIHNLSLLRGKVLLYLSTERKRKANKLYDKKKKQTNIASNYFNTLQKGRIKYSYKFG